MIILVALGGGLGACIRYLVDMGIRAVMPQKLPWATLAINVSGSFILGALTGWLAPGLLLSVIGTGVMGGYTTFSTASVEVVSQKTVRAGALYAALTVILAVGAAAAGMALTGYF